MTLMDINNSMEYVLKNVQLQDRFMIQLPAVNAQQVNNMLP